TTGTCDGTAARTASSSDRRSFIERCAASPVVPATMIAFTPRSARCDACRAVDAASTLPCSSKKVTMAAATPVKTGSGTGSSLVGSGLGTAVEHAGVGLVPRHQHDLVDVDVRGTGDREDDALGDVFRGERREPFVDLRGARLVTCEPHERELGLARAGIDL